MSSDGLYLEPPQGGSKYGGIDADGGGGLEHRWRALSAPDPRGWPAVPGYELEALIGRGAFGAVYRARQIAVDRLVAVKVLSSAAFGAETERRFRAECKSIGSLSWHNHVVSLHDAGVTSHGELFLVMEFVPGGSLGDRVRDDGALASEVVVQVGVQMADALGAAHDAGVLHRDIKPDNILIDRRGSFLLSDFGIATIDDATRTATGNFTGTYAYSAPELLNGERATARSDVYSLGATLYTLAAGRAAFTNAGDATPAALLLRILSDPPPPLPARTPPVLAAVITKALAKDPAARYPSATDLQRALQSLAPVAPDEVTTRPGEVSADHPEEVLQPDPMSAAASLEAPPARDELGATVRESRLVGGVAGVGSPRLSSLEVNELVPPGHHLRSRPSVPRVRHRSVAVGLVVLAVSVGGVVLLSNRSQGSQQSTRTTQTTARPRPQPSSTAPGVVTTRRAVVATSGVTTTATESTTATTAANGTTTSVSLLTPTLSVEPVLKAGEFLDIPFQTDEATALPIVSRALGSPTRHRRLTIQNSAAEEFDFGAIRVMFRADDFGKTWLDEWVVDTPNTRWAMDTGIHVGSSLSELEAAYPDGKFVDPSGSAEAFCTHGPYVGVGDSEELKFLLDPQGKVVISIHSAIYESC